MILWCDRVRIAFDESRAYFPQLQLPYARLGGYRPPLINILVACTVSRHTDMILIISEVAVASLTELNKLRAARLWLTTSYIADANVQVVFLFRLLLP